jgi:hypothetical protein
VRISYFYFVQPKDKSDEAQRQALMKNQSRFFLLRQTAAVRDTKEPGLLVSFAAVFPVYDKPRRF